MNKEYLVAVMMDVQAGARSCRHAAKEVMEWSDEQAAENAALKAEVAALRASNAELLEALKDLMDCEHMDEVRYYAKTAIRKAEGGAK